MKISTKGENQRNRRVYAEEEQRLLAACDQMNCGEHQWSGRLLRDRIIAALDTGARQGEMLLIQNRHVDSVKHRILLPGTNTKSAKTRAVPFDPSGRLAEVLQKRRFLGPDAYVFGDPDGGFVRSFRSAWESLLVLVAGKNVERASRKSRVQVKPVLRGLDLHWHDLRHEAACRWREQGLDLREIQLLLGHSTLLMTQRYLNVSDDELATAMSEKMWKRA